MSLNMTNLYHVFSEHLKAEKPLFLNRDQQCEATYGALDSRSAQYAGALLKAGLEPGDRVAVQIEKSYENIYLYCGCLRAGLIYLPLNTAYQASELSHFINDAKPKLFVIDPAASTAHLDQLDHQVQTLTLDQEGFGSLRDWVDASPAHQEIFPSQNHDVAVIVYTSGTTGLPKGAMISHGNLVSNVRTLRSAWGWTEHDVMLHTLPIFHVHGLFVGLHLPLLSNSPVILMASFNADSVIKALPHATVFMGVPTYYTRLLSSGISPKDCANMRLFTSGSAPLLSQTFTDWEQATGTTILERYGMTETGMNTSNPLEGQRKKGTVGPPLPGVECRAVDASGMDVAPGETGDLWVRGKNVFHGYWQNAEKTAESFTDQGPVHGFFKTGDLASIDPEGYVTIVGRNKDLIISGGLNVYPKEIELLIDQLDGVLESAVIGLPHPDFGESVCAVIVPTRENDRSEDDIISLLKADIANFKVPKHVFFIPELPRNTMGKVQKNELRTRFSPPLTS